MGVATNEQSVAKAARNPAVASFLNGPKKLLINGKWVAPKSGKTFETINPATEDVLTLIAEGDKADVDEAVKAARKALEEGKWGKIGPHERARFLYRIAELIDKHTDELAELETLDNGKGVMFSKAFDVPAAAETFRYYAGWCTKLYGETNPSDPSMFNYTLREPVGVCGQIIPWNFPLLMAAWKLAPALACGCTIVLKLAEQTPYLRSQYLIASSYAPVYGLLAKGGKSLFIVDRSTAATVFSILRTIPRDCTIMGRRRFRMTMKPKFGGRLA